jgi:Tfp pilus assembly protein PilX
MIKNTQKGFTLFIAVLVGSLMLAIGFSIFNLTFKELLLSASARDSQIAFYAADTGLECALYYDQKEDIFSIAAGVNSVSITCAGQPSLIVPRGRTLDGDTYTWNWVLDNGKLCTVIEVSKDTDVQRTVIRSFGYSTCSSTDPRRTERGLRVTYSGL